MIRSPVCLMLRPLRTCLACQVALLVFSCSSARDDKTQKDASVDSAVPSDLLVDEGASDDREAVRFPFVAVTFNTGTGGKAPAQGNYGYNETQAHYCDEYYGNGLSWKPFVEMTRLWFETVDPDVVVFQEIFWCGDCPEVPGEAWPGFVCEDWASGKPTVLEMLLTTGYQLMCNPKKPDKCAAVHQRFGSFAGCDEPFCLEGMQGIEIPGCGKGVRMGKGVIELVSGGELTLVNVHGSSGFTEEDAECRKKQFEQVFVDAGDGQPLADGQWNLIMGDFNTDPVVMAESDVSAARVLDFVGEGKQFHFITQTGSSAPPTYGLMSIDHVISNVLTGSCWHAGVTAGHDAVMDAFFFDHIPAVCSLEFPTSDLP